MKSPSRNRACALTSGAVAGGIIGEIDARSAKLDDVMFRLFEIERAGTAA